MKSPTRIGVAAGVALALSGCGTLYTLDVTAYNNPNLELELDKTYVILSGNPDINVNSPEFQAYADQVERALSPKGYRRLTEDGVSSAALGVYVSVDVGDASKRFHKVSTAVYETPYAENSTDVLRSSGNSQASRGGTGQQGQQPTPVNAPAREVLAGYEEAGFATTVYTKHLNLVAIDLQKYIEDIASVGRTDAVPKEVWSIDVETTGQPKNLDEVVPVMVAAGQPYVGASTEDVITVKMSETDRRIDAIRGN